jgi:hypothetical protein
MVILHAFLALLAGFATLAILIGLATAALTRFVPEWTGTPGQPKAGYIFVNLGYSLAAALVGGYITASFAHGNPLHHVLALALIVLLLSALSALQERGKQPIWYQLTLIALTPIGVFLGGLLRLKLLGL